MNPNARHRTRTLPFMLLIAVLAGAWLWNNAPPGQATASNGQFLFYHIDRTAVPNWVRQPDVTLQVVVGDAQAVTVVADGQAIAYDYAHDTGLVTFTTGGSDLILYVAPAGTAQPADFGQISVAPLRNNKQWAYSLTMDDGFLSQLTTGTRYLNRYGYRAASAIEGHWMDEDGSPWDYLQPDDVRALRAAGWSIFNHSYAHFSADAISDLYGDILHAQQVLERELDGYTPLVFTVPFAIVPGYEAVIDAHPHDLGLHLVQLADGNTDALTFVAPPLTYPNEVLHIGRFDVRDAARRFESAYQVGAPVWLSLHTHNVEDTCLKQTDGTWTQQEWVASTSEKLYQTYGAAGTDEVWVAPADEVFQYLTVRDAIQVTQVFTSAPPLLSLSPYTRTQTVLLQQGRDGYAGSIATTINAWNPNATASNQQSEQLTLRADRVKDGLVRFSLPALPAGAQVLHAAVSVYALDHTNQNVVWVNAYPLRRNWVASEATWVQAANNEAWEQPGAADPNADRIPTSSDRRGFQQCADTGGEWYTLDVTSIVQNWAADSASNNGLLLEASSSSTGISLASPTYQGNAALRPKLLVTYAYPEQPVWPGNELAATASPTPTATATDGPSPTPSPTVTASSSPTPSPTATPATAFPLANLPALSDRFGVGVNGAYGHITDYDLSSLHAGWFSNWKTGAKPSLPGLDYAQVISVKPSAYPPNWPDLAATVRANAGALWIVGNEPEGIYGQGERTPPEYAQIYHDVYTFIKNTDPTAVLAIGGVIEPTLLRLQWLDQVLSNYQGLYGEPMPVDVWNTHVQILQEQRGSWGAAIPAGLAADHGRLYTPQDNADPNIFRTLVQEFRQWMVARGLQDRPLIISEYGVLMPYCYLVDEPSCITDINASVAGRQQVKDFMTQTFTFLLNAQDPSVGYPADENRLVQRWLWYSLNEMSFDPNSGLGFSGGLFDWQTAQMTEFGHVFSDTVTPLVTPYTDLTLRGFQVSPDSVTPGQPVTFTLQARVANRGETPVSNVTVRFWDGDPNQGGQQIGSDQVISDTMWRYGAGADITLSWPNVTLKPGQRLDITAAVDPDNQFSEAVENNNRLHHVVWAPQYRLYLPVTRSYAVSLGQDFRSR